MRYFKIERDGIILAIGKGNSGVEITKGEYLELTEAVKNKPVLKSGIGCRLLSDKKWQKYKLPISKEN